MRAHVRSRIYYRGEEKLLLIEESKAFALLARVPDVRDEKPRSVEFSGEFGESSLLFLGRK